MFYLAKTFIQDYTKRLQQSRSAILPSSTWAPSSTSTTTASSFLPPYSTLGGQCEGVCPHVNRADITGNFVPPSPHHTLVLLPDAIHKVYDSLGRW